MKKYINPILTGSLMGISSFLPMALYYFLEFIDNKNFFIVALFLYYVGGFLGGGTAFLLYLLYIYKLRMNFLIPPTICTVIFAVTGILIDKNSFNVIYGMCCFAAILVIWLTAAIVNKRGKA